MDDVSAVSRRLRQLADAAHAHQPSGAGALWRAPDQGRPGDLRPAERARMGDVLRQGAGAAGTRHRSALPRQHRPPRASARTDRADRRLLRRHDIDRGGEEAGRGRHRQRPAERAARRVGARAVHRARPLARDRHAGRPGARAAAAVHLHRRGGGDGRRPGTRPAHRRGAARTRLCRGGDRTRCTRPERYERVRSGDASHGAGAALVRGLPDWANASCCRAGR